MVADFLWVAAVIGEPLQVGDQDKLLVVCAYGLCYFALTRAMSTIPVGVAYSLWCGFGIVGVTICSMILYKQKPDLAAIIAMALIISGGVIMNVFSTM